jgi:hypothetical protein
MDEHAMTQPEVLRRDVLRDYPVAIHTASTTPQIAAPYMLIGDFVTANQREHTPHRGNNRRFTTDPEFVAQTGDHATPFDGNFFPWSFRMDAPLMPKTSNFKFSKRDFLSFLSIKAAALILQLALSLSCVPINPIAQRYAHAMLPHLCRHSKPAAHAIAGVSAGLHDCGTVAWEMCERHDAQSISRTHSLLDRMMVRHASGHAVSDYVQSFTPSNNTLTTLPSASN